ncbi:MAG: RNA polymerase sigma factor [Solirubrobacteraceae bacterium]
MTDDNDRRRFERLYGEHFDRVAAYLLSRADPAMAEDALARTFEIAWRRLADVPRDPLPWLLGVARRTLADLRRGQGRQDALIERIGATLVPRAGDHAEALGERNRLLAALRNLSEPQREVLLLVAWDGLSQREAAAVLGCSRGAVALRLHRARARLRAAACEEELVEPPRHRHTPSNTHVFEEAR